MLAPCTCASNNARALLPWLPQGGVASAQISLSPSLPIAALISSYLNRITPTHTRFLRQENKGTSSAIQCAWHLPSARSCITTSTSVSHCHMHNFITQSCVFVPSSSQQFHPWSISIIHSLPSILWSLCAFGRLCWVWFEPAQEVDVAIHGKVLNHVQLEARKEDATYNKLIVSVCGERECFVVLSESVLSVVFVK